MFFGPSTTEGLVLKPTAPEHPSSCVCTQNSAFNEHAPVVEARRISMKSQWKLSDM